MIKAKIVMKTFNILKYIKINNYTNLHKTTL